MVQITAAERRARIGVKHRLATEAQTDDPVAAAQAVVALHGTDAASVYLSCLARMREGRVSDVEDALYLRKSLWRILSMRRTMWVTTPETAVSAFAACSVEVAKRERTTLLKLLTESSVGDEAWIAAAEDKAMAALATHGEATAPELGEYDPMLATQLVLAPGTKNEARQKVISRLLTLLSAEGRVIRTRPKGSWNSTQFRWAALESWTGAPLPRPNVVDAAADLARRYLAQFGPATVEDLRWWAGWTVARANQAIKHLHVIEHLDVIEVDLDGEPGIMLADDELVAPSQWAALLPALDATTMGWKRRDFYLGTHGPALFDTTGNAGPTVWIDGRVVGGWARADDGEIRIKLLESVGGQATDLIDRAAEQTMKRVSDVSLAPRARGRSSVERELLA